MQHVINVITLFAFQDFDNEVCLILELVILQGATASVINHLISNCWQEVSKLKYSSKKFPLPRNLKKLLNFDESPHYNLTISR